MLQSSAYRTNLCPLLSNSLSSSSSTMFESRGLNGPPCGVPSVVFDTTPLIMTPDCKYLRINFSNGLSWILFASVLMSLSWLTLSKNFSKSISTTIYILLLYTLSLSLPHHGHFDLVGNRSCFQRM